MEPNTLCCSHTATAVAALVWPIAWGLVAAAVVFMTGVLIAERGRGRHGN